MSNDLEKMLARKRARYFLDEEAEDEAVPTKAYQSGKENLYYGNDQQECNVLQKKSILTTIAYIAQQKLAKAYRKKRKLT